MACAMRGTRHRVPRSYLAHAAKPHETTAAERALAPLPCTPSLALHPPPECSALGRTRTPSRLSLPGLLLPLIAIRLSGGLTRAPKLCIAPPTLQGIPTCRERVGSRLCLCHPQRGQAFLEAGSDVVPLPSVSLAAILTNCTSTRTVTIEVAELPPRPSPPPWLSALLPSIITRAV